ncbi:MAG: bifunctional homocysteine S-methyltransferase/methylenetetrahydrofolate reductase [Phototrophicaceae bacterium]
MPKPSFSERLAQQKPILGDGAIGTLLVQRGNLSLNKCFDQLNLTQPALVEGTHTDYIEAGSELIETNTFGANRFKLSEYGLADSVVEINQAGVRLAQQAAAKANYPIYVAGAVGPLGVSLQPYGRVSREDGKAVFVEQLQALLDSGIDAILFETFNNHDELILAVETARELDADIPIIAQATFSTDNITSTGHNPARVASDLHQTGATVIGVNCGTGPSQISRILQTMHNAVPDAKYSALPNAGFPLTVGGRAMYPATAEYFGDYALTFEAIGAQIVGGCCGTTPQHIAAMRQALDDPQRVAPEFQVVQVTETDLSTQNIHPTDLAQRLIDGKFTVTVEMTPPRGYDTETMLREARLLRDAGAFAIDVADTPAAKMKMSAWAVSHLLQDHIGIETVLHFPTRGRNILRVQGDLLAAHALGLRNLFVTMGDPTHIGDYPEAMDTYDIVPSKLIAVIKQDLNNGKDMAGNSIGVPTHFNVGCALNMAADNLDREIKVLLNKLEGGADFALGQAVFDPPRIESFLKRYQEMTGEDFNLPVIMGLIPLHSVRQARFLHNEVPGIVIPDAIFERLEAADEDQVAQVGSQIAIELMQQMRGYVQGAYIIPSGRYKSAATIVDAIVHAPVNA